jgi:hypothetical protein
MLKGSQIFAITILTLRRNPGGTTGLIWVQGRSIYSSKWWCWLSYSRVIWGPAFACSILFFLAAVKFPLVKSKFSAINWTRWDKWVRRANYVMLVVAALSFIWLISTIRSVFRQHGPVTPPVAASKPVPTSPVGHLDWHDKQNWRQNLHTGMTRTEARQLFGDPEEMSVVSNSEFWRYGSGQIQFDMDSHSDGSLVAWFEPSS